MRMLIELSLNAGKKRLNPQTGFIHHHYHAVPGEESFTIPVLENVYYALTLFRTKNAENIALGKTLLEKILYFQSPAGYADEGDFPIYLHEYPKCYDQFQPLHLLAPFYWLLKKFSAVLGHLKQLLIKVCQKLLTLALNLHAEKPLPYLFAVKLAASYAALKELIEVPSSPLKLDDYCNQRQEWQSSKALREVLISLQMVYPSLPNSPWSDFWSYLNQTWHPLIKTYVGPAHKEFQKGVNPQRSLYDLFCGYFGGAFADDSLKDEAFHLQACLIQATEDRFKRDLTTWRDDRSFCLIENDHAMSVIEYPPEFYDKGHHFFRLVWGKGEFLHSLVCQEGNVQRVQSTIENNTIRLEMTLGNLIDFEDRERQREVSFYLNLFDGIKFLIEDQTSNTFALNEIVEVCVENVKLQISFTLVEGEGRFLGHIVRNNRPAQTLNKGLYRYEAYDWQICLRTLKRTEPCRIAATISFVS